MPMTASGSVWIAKAIPPLTEGRITYVQLYVVVLAAFIKALELLHIRCCKSLMTQVLCGRMLDVLVLRKLQINHMVNLDRYDGA
jgi:hypothetical protein